jgi:hypothetical protein
VIFFVEFTNALGAACQRHPSLQFLRLAQYHLTPASIVKLIVEVIEPYHGMIFDPACGSGYRRPLGLHGFPPGPPRP